MDKRKSILNVCVSVGFKFLTMIMALVVKRFLIKICGNDVNGLNALYLSIIGVLSIAELGVGNAIIFCMYKPIVEGDNDTVSALYHLFRKTYLIVGGIIFSCGLAITPFIKIFAKDYQQLDVNLEFTFILMLISIVVTYLFACKTSLINAYKNNYITTTISSSGILLQHILQIVTLIVTRSFVGYLLCRIIVVLLQWAATEFIARKKYYPLISNIAKLKKSVKKEVLKNIKAMFMHRVGNMLVNTVDSVVISTFVGVVSLGFYSNYTMILTSMTEIVKLVFTSLTSVIGHLYAGANKEITKKYCERFHLLNFVLGCVFFLGYYAVIDSLISILFSVDLIASKSLSLVITLNGFVQFMRQSMFMFRGATGTFYNDRWKPLFEGLTNFVLSVILVQRIGIVGVLIATIITNLAICHIVEPYVLYKNAFESSPKKYYINNYSMIVLFSLALGLLDYFKQMFNSHWKTFFVNGFISVGISAVICGIVVIINSDICKQFLTNIKRRIKK